MKGRIVHADQVDTAMEDWRRERPDLDPDDMEIGDRIQRIASRLQGGANAALTPYGIGQPGYAVLAALRRAGDPFELTPGELSRAVLLTSGAMTNRIDRLERVGLVERRRRAGDDRRSVRIRLTRKGRELEALATTARFGEAARVTGGLSQSERDRLRVLLRKMEAGLGERR